MQHNIYLLENFVSGRLDGASFANVIENIHNLKHFL